jgi:hypothetical protein
LETGRVNEPARPATLSGNQGDLVMAGCDQCEALVINGVFCHETGCPNTRKVKVDGEWVEPEDEEDWEWVEPEDEEDWE